MLSPFVRHNNNVTAAAKCQQPGYDLGLTCDSQQKCANMVMTANDNICYKSCGDPFGFGGSTGGSTGGSAGGSAGGSGVINCSPVLIGGKLVAGDISGCGKLGTVMANRARSTISATLSSQPVMTSPLPPPPLARPLARPLTCMLPARRVLRVHTDPFGTSNGGVRIGDITTPDIFQNGTPSVTRGSLTVVTLAWWAWLLIALVIIAFCE